jgi:hypothetical protein
LEFTGLPAAFCCHQTRFDVDAVELGFDHEDAAQPEGQTLTTGDKTSTLPLRRAVANLLRLANWNVKDAELLVVGRNPENAPFLLDAAVRRVVEAVVATEQGWPIAGDIKLERIPDDNPLKFDLARIAKLAQPPKALALLPDGNFPPSFDREAFPRDVGAVKGFLQELVERFGVNLLGDGPAERAAAVRPQATPKPEPPRPEPKPEPKPSKAPVQIHPRTPAAKPRTNDGQRPSPVVVPNTRASDTIEADPHAVAGRSPLAVAPARASLTSAAFWALMDRWNVPDLAALEMIGHAGGLSKKGTRPRFKLAGDEADRVRRLVEIADALSALGLDPKDWLNKPVRAAPFKGATLIEYLTRNGLEGVREVSRYILRNGLKLSMAGTPRS